MSKSKTRSSKAKDNGAISNKSNRVPVSRKIFFMEEKLLLTEVTELKFEHFFHPGKGKVALFMTSDEKNLMEVLEYAEPRRSWLINNSVCSNGRIYITNPVDSTFLALHQLRKHCAEKALALDCIHDENDKNAQRLLTTYMTSGQLRCIADEKSVGELLFYKYNASKAIAWLTLKTRHVAKALKRNHVYCGYSSLSQNYTKSEIEQTALESDFLRAACEIVGSNVDLELYKELKIHLQISEEKQANVELKAVLAEKRKSLKALNESINKKIKLNEKQNTCENLKEDSLIDISLDSTIENGVNSIHVCEMKLKSTPNERALTAKEKSFAKSAKGTKSISSFFKK